jgi:hypothetical protein
LKKKPITIGLPDGSEVKLSVYWTVKISDLITEIADQAHLDPNSHFLCLESSMQALFPWSSLKELNIPYNAKLLLKHTKDTNATPVGDVNIWEEKNSEEEAAAGYTINGLIIKLSTSKDYGKMKI